MLLGYCSLQVEVAGIGRANVNQRMLFPLVRTDRAESLIRRALPELPWPSQPLLVLPARLHRRYLTVPLEYAAGFTLLMLFLPGLVEAVWRFSRCRWASYSASPGRERPDGGLTTSPWSCGGGDYWTATRSSRIAVVRN